MTLQGSAAYGKHEKSCDWCGDDYDGWDLQASLTYYFNDNWSGTVGVGRASWSYYDGDTDMTTLSLAAEYHVPDTNYSIRGGYVYGDADDTYNDYTANSFQVAFIVDLGSDNARDRDQHGASLNGAEAFDQHWRLWESCNYGFVD
jgi:long-subunit fatty acid transport protein